MVNYYKNGEIKSKTNKLRLVSFFLVIIFILSNSGSVFASTNSNEGYTNLASSNILPLLSNKDVAKLNTVEPEKQLSITIGLKIRNKEKLKQKIKTAHTINNFGRAASDQDIKNNFMPDMNMESEVIQFLKDNNLKITKTYNSHMLVQASGSVKDIENAFKIQLNYYSYDGEGFFANSDNPQVPTSLVSIIENIDGLNNYKLKPKSKSSKLITPNFLNSSSCLTPQQIQTAYNFTSAYNNNINGKGIKVAVASYYSFNQSDISYYLNYFGINGTNSISVIPVGGTPTFNQEYSSETTMDVELAVSNAPGSQLLVYDGADNTSNVELNLFSQIVDDGQANVVTYSWGAEEAQCSQAYINELDNIFMTGSAKGITFVAASGDSGSNSISFPASDPYVTAVGGTALTLNSNTNKISSETAWDLDNSGAGSGGGLSSVFSIPYWQQGISTQNSKNRMIPDVSLDASPSTGYAVYFDGKWYQSGGTSASSPVWASIFALVDQSRQKNGLGNIGQANPSLYSLAGQSIFNDITIGSNGAYSCTSGYDMVTGLGSVNVWKLISALTTKNTQVHAITYNGNGNTGGSSPADNNEYVEGYTTTVLDNTGNLVKTGYLFQGWNTAADGSGQTYAAGSSITVGSSNITLYAKWKLDLALKGCLDTPTNGSVISGTKTVSGWFLDSDNISKVEVLIDGSVVGTAVYGDSRPDVRNVYPEYNNTNSGYHYNLDTTTLTNGLHTIVIRETANSGKQTSLGAVTVTVSNTTIGCLDAPTNGSVISGTKTVSGWFLDNSGVSKIELLIDGSVAGTAVCGDSRPDVQRVFPAYNNANSGYHYNLDTTNLANGSHTIVIRETGNNEKQTSLGTVTVTVSNITIGCLDAPTNGLVISGTKTVSGWFLDNSGISKIEVLIDGSVAGTAIYGDSRPDVQKVFPSYNNTNSGYHYNLDTTALTDGTHTIVIRETGRNNRQTSLGAISVTVSNTTGCLDTPTNGSIISGTKTVSGWYLDNSGVSKIEVLIDGSVAGTAVYGDSRPDVQKVFPSYNNTNSGYHYNLDTTTLANGSHTIVIRETGNDGKQTSLGTVTVTVSNITIGCLDTPTNGSVISGTKTVSGWFLDNSGVSKIEVLIDGSVSGIAAYGDSRPDVQNVFPAYNNINSGYHYNLDTRALADGTHTIVIRETGGNNRQTSLEAISVTVSNTAGCLDTPTNGSIISGTKTVSGWYLDNSGVSKIEVLIDGSVAGTAIYGDSRPDVQKVFSSYNNTNSGYHYSLDTTRFKNGKHTIGIRETGNNNRQMSLGEVTVTVSN